MSLDNYERDGFLIIRNMITTDECDSFKIEAQRIFNANAHPDATVCVHASVASQLFNRFHADRRLIDILKKIMPDGVMFLSDKIVVKTADKTFATPWHMDCFYWPNTRSKLSIWIPFDDVTADNGALTVVRGSHKKTWTMHTKALSNGEFLYQIADEEVNQNDVVICSIKRGDAIIFSDRLVHGSTTNRAQIDRYTIISTYQAPAEDETFDLDFPARRILN